MKQPKTPPFLEKLRPFIKWWFRGFILLLIIVVIVGQITSPSLGSFLLWSIAIGVFAYTVKDIQK